MFPEKTAAYIGKTTSHSKNTVCISLRKSLMGLFVDAVCPVLDKNIVFKVLLEVLKQIAFCSNEVELLLQTDHVITQNRCFLSSESHFS